MVRAEPKNIRLRVLIPLSLTFAVLIGTFSYTTYNIRQDAMSHAIDHRYKGVRALYKEFQVQRLGLLTAITQHVSHQPVMQRAMLLNDRVALQRMARPLFEELRSQYGISLLYFFDVDRKVVFRAHRPEEFGDQVNRSTLRNAEEKRALSYGLELGKLGEYAFRVVIPWVSADNQLLGYIEIGEEISQVLLKLKKITNTDFIVAIDKNFLDRVSWEKGMQLLQRPANWNLLLTRVIINQTIPDIPHAVERQLFWDYQEGKHYHTETTKEKTYQIKTFPLFDVAENRIGDFAMLLDVTYERTAFIKFMLKVGIFTLVVCSTLFTFAFRTLGRMDRVLNNAREDLYSEIDKADVLNSKLTVEVVERKRAEEELRSLNVNLEQRIMERTRKLETLNSEIEANRRELERAYEDLKLNQTTILHQDKMANIGQLAAGVAHDINNPIGFVSNNLSELDHYIKDLCEFMSLQCRVIDQLKPDEEIQKLLNDKRAELQLDEMVEDLDDIISETLEGAQRVSKIVQNLRKFSRVDESDYEQTDIHECLDSTINISSNELRYKAEVVRNYGDLPQIFCYPGQLNQVFMNLLINAAQSMSGYGQIKISTWTHTNSIFIKFEDTGAGIPKEIVDRIFEPFFTTKDAGTGTGLGLSITYDIIQKHDGDIWVESEEGKGTTFVIGLPVKQRGNA